MASIGQARIDIVADASGFGSTASKEVTKALDGVASDAAKVFDGIEADSSDAFDSIADAAASAGTDASRSLRDVMREVESMTDSAARSATSSLGDISSAAGRAGRDTSRSMSDGLSGISRAASSAASDASSALGGISTSATRHGSAAAEGMGRGFSSIRASASRAAEWAGNSFRGVGASISKSLDSAASSARSAAGSIKSSLTGAFREAESSVLRIPPAIGGIGMALAAVAGPAAMLKGGFDRLMAIQRAEITFKSIGLSAEETEAQMSKLSDQVTGTSLSLADAAKYSAMFAQSGVDMGEPMDNTIRAFANLSSAAEGTGVDVGRVLQGISAQGKVTGEDLNQLSGAGVNAAQYLADHMGMSVAEIREAVSAGEIGFTDFVDAMNAGMGDLAKDMGETLPAKIGNFKTAVSNLGATIIEPFLPGITAAVEFGISITKGAVGPLKDFIAWLQEGSEPAERVKDVLVALGIALAAAFTPALIGLILAAGSAIASFGAAVWAATGPVGLAIGAVVAAFVLLWRNSETFRNFWIGLWDVLKRVVSGAVDWVKGAFETAQEAFTAVWEFMQSAWESVGRPVFDAIVTAGKWMFAIVATAVLAPLLIAWNVLSAGIKFAWETFIKPSWDALAAAAVWLWETVLRPVFGFISSAWGALGSAVLWVWDNVIKRAWDALAAGLTSLWNTVVNPVLGWISDRWAWMGDALHSVWEWISDKVFGALGRGLDKVKEAFQVAVDAITRIWNGVKKAAAAPVKFVIDTVWNNGILKAWNAVAGLVGLDTQDNITHDLGGYWRGGIVPGARSVGRDNMRFISEDGSASIGLAGGEGIAHQHVVDAIGKENWLALNKRAAASGPGAVEEFLGGFARGGIVPSIVGLVNRFFPGMTITSTYRNTADYHGQGKAVDFSNGGNAGTPQMKAAARFFYDNYAPMLAELIHWPLAGWQNIKNGAPLNYGAATNAQHRNHVHVAAHSPLPEPGSPITPISSGGGGFFQSLVDIVKGMWDSAIGKIGSWTEGGGAIAALPGAFLKKAGSLAWDFVREKAESIGGWFTGGGSATQWASVASEALRRHGYGDEHLDRTLRQIQIESTGDPSAINLTDSNARRGTPSKGLLQVIDPTYRRVRARYASAFAGLPDNIWDPLTNVTAGVGAVRADWGGPAGRWPTTAGYHKGGLMGDGDGWFHKTAMEPEMILSPTQTEAFIDWMRAGIPDSGDVASRFAGEVVDLLGAREARTYPVRDERGRGGATRIVQVTQNIYGSDSASDSAGRIIDLLDRWN